MNKILIFSIIGVTLLIIIIFFFIKRKKKNDTNSVEELIITDDKIFQNKELEINITAIDFKVLGNKDMYTISFKGDRILFFVKDNEIIGFLNKDKSNRIYYYKKEEGEDKNV